MDERHRVALLFYNKYYKKILKTANIYPKEMLDDLLQEAYVAIHGALCDSKYQDNLEGTSFRKFIHPRVHYYMQAYYYRNKGPVKVSQRLKDAPIFVEEFKDFQQDGGSCPEEILIGTEMVLSRLNKE